MYENFLYHEGSKIEEKHEITLVFRIEFVFFYE